ncbi:beta-lactamase family protein [Nonomuraea sp. K274]|uniref:Beta-lactamase family protein n=2 Tax=Nonomuraea cypriaca TaxID=1187855 RepID=A0A931F4Z2_9ACTN|nr:beta-lactamase family protein [Nonomuraea cypriaca]
MVAGRPAAAATVSAGMPADTVAGVAADVVARGQVPSALVPFDRLMKDYMAKRGITAGQLAIARKGKLVFARAYTVSTPEKPVPAVTPTSLFRIASLSKHVTATAVLRLAQEGRLNLGDPVTKWLSLVPMPGKTADPRLSRVTLWRLLQHTGGWDRDISGDPCADEHAIATALGRPLPISHTDLFEYVTGRRLDWDPGTRMAYSNYGYMLLGRVIEKVTGQSYESYVTNTLLTPLGISRMRIGPSLQTAGEVPYESRYTTRTVLDNSGQTMSFPYGGFNMANRDASGGWVAAAVDLVRFERIFDLPTTANLLNSTSIGRAFAKPEIGVSDGGSWYGAGWYVREKNGGLNTWHNGSMAGTYTYLVRRYDGVTYAALFNRRKEDDGALTDGEIDPLLYNAADAVTTWPSVDYGSLYF